MCESIRSPDAIVVGTGLAGLTTSLALALRGKKVVILEKSNTFGGNSILATSGINGVPTKYQPVKGDRIEKLVEDTLNAGKDLCNQELVQLMAKNSSVAINWLSNWGIDLLHVLQLNGHSMPRTHRGYDKVLPGYAIIPVLMDKIEQSPNVSVLMNSSLTKIKIEHDLFASIEYTLSNGETETLRGSNLVLATGGYAADTEGVDSLIKKYRPDLADLPNTNSASVTGDGHKIVARDCNVKFIDMDQVQINPTGFVDLDLKHVNSRHKILCAGLLRDVGGILISPNTGKRYVNELQSRAVVSEATFDCCKVNDSPYSKAQKYMSLIIIDSKDVNKAATHINFYISNNLIHRGSLKDVSEFVKIINKDFLEDNLVETLEAYNLAASQGDEFGRKVFGSSFDSGDYYYGFVTPVTHFSMGGIAINQLSQVIANDGSVMENFYSVGESSGGIHGRDRLGGNSLLECAVFGLIAGQNI